MSKPYTTYIAFTRAIDDYCERHDITRGCFALRIGFTGPSAENQISNHLNPNNTKNISHEREQRILHQLDDEARELYFKMRTKEFGMSVCLDFKALELLDDDDFHGLADAAMIEGDEAFATTKRALQDGSLSHKELKQIAKECRESAQHYERMADVAEMKLGVV